MRYYPENRDNTPLRHIGQVPVYVTTILTALYVAGLLATTLLQAVGGQLGYFEFSTELFFLHGWLWQIVTCTFVNWPTPYFLLWIYVLYRCGIEVELFFGRRTLLKFYALQIVAVVLVLGIERLTGRQSLFGGMAAITTGFFIGFATLYPNLQWFGLVAMKYVAGAFLGIMVLSDLASHQWSELSVLLAIGGTSFGFIRHAKLGGSLDSGEWVKKLFRRQPKFRVMPSPERPAVRPSPMGGSIVSVDAILDKIARDGFASLTQDERDQLERARDILNRKKS